MFGIGTPEILIIIVAALLIFGPSKLPELGKTLGKGLREFKKASSDLKDHVNPLSEVEENKHDSYPAIDSAPLQTTGEKTKNKPSKTNKKSTVKTSASASIPSTKKSANTRAKKTSKSEKFVAESKPKGKKGSIKHQD